MMKCFLDIDGVLANFNKRAFEALGLVYSYDHPALRDWCWYNYFNISLEELDSVCTIGFWAGLQWMHDGRQIFDLVMGRFGFENIYLLSTPMPNPESATGKMLWVQRHLPAFVKRTIITQAPKALFAAQNCCLVDDRNENIDMFIVALQHLGVALAGEGRAILVPRPWNRGVGTDTLRQLEIAL